MRMYRFLPALTGWFAALLVVTNVLNNKIFALGPFALPAGIVTFPLAFVFADILTEVYGYAVTRRTIWIGFVALMFMALAVEAGRLLPPAVFWQNQNAYEVILGQVPRIVIASMFAYFAGEFANSYVLAKMKVWTNGESMSLRFIGSTLAGQAVDTLVFMTVAFLGVYPAGAMLKLFLSAWAFKVVWEIIALPVTVPLVRWIKRVEQEDYFDRETNFNPFHLAPEAGEATGLKPAL
jgi:queuosine precursor transporter